MELSKLRVESSLKDFVNLLKIEKNSNKSYKLHIID